MDNPGASVLYIGLTRESAKRIIGKDVLHVINKTFNLQAKFNASELSYTFPNGSVIYLAGADADDSQMSKLLGQKYSGVVVDEAAFYGIDLKKLVLEILEPATMDLRGQIILISTTSDIPRGFYYDVVNGIEKGWSVHKWTALDNPFMREKTQERMRIMKEMNPDVEKTPKYRRMMLNEWVIQDDLTVYKITEKNVIQLADLPKTRSMPTYVAGLDLGWNDATSIVVTASYPHDKTLYIVDSWSASNKLAHEVAEVMKSFQSKYEGIRWFADPASKQVLEDLKQRHNLKIQPTEKLNKNVHIELLNNDFNTNHLIITDNNADLIKQCEELVWDERALAKGNRIENQSAPNDLCDAMLYAWRSAAAYRAKPAPTPKSLEDEMFERATIRTRKMRY